MKANIIAKTEAPQSKESAIATSKPEADWITPFENMFEQILAPFNIFDDLLSLSDTLPDAFPKISVGETETEMILNINLPGAEKKDVSINVEGRTLTISAETNMDIDDCYSCSKFMKSFTLPDGVDVKGIVAKHEGETLTVSIPLPEKQTPTAVPVQ